ncbi:MAG TPA: ERAP1-like C-terminal domain-containing protein, partial [Chthoniobacterales bacterium]
LNVVARYADEKTWNKLHDLALETTSIEEKQNFSDALTSAADPKLAEKTLRIALTDELPTTRAVYLVPKVARNGGHADLVWQFAKTNMKALLAKSDALGASRFGPSLFTFFSDTSRIDELRSYAKANLTPASKQHVEAAADEIGFRAEFKKRLIEQVTAIKPSLRQRD